MVGVKTSGDLVLENFTKEGSSGIALGETVMRLALMFVSHDVNGVVVDAPD